VVLIIEDHSELQLTEREVNDFRNIVGIMWDIICIICELAQHLEKKKIDKW
jgi:hypothetical protein